MTLTTPTHQGTSNSHGSLPTIARLDREKRFTARNGGPTRREDCFLGPFVQRRREMAHPAPTKGFSRLSPKAAMLPRLSAETHPPPPVPPSLLAQSLSPKDIAGSLTSLMKVSCRIYPATSGKGLIWLLKWLFHYSVLLILWAPCYQHQVS